MKRFYSLLALLLMASTIYAQTLSVTVNDKTVNEGETVECEFDEIEKHPIPILTVYEMAPHVVVKSSVAQEVSLEIDVLEKKGEDQVQNCFVNCITANATNNYVVKETTEMLANQEKDAQIHFTTKSNPNENPLERHVKVTVSSASETISFVLHMYWDPNGILSVESVETGEANSAIYSISGSQLDKNNVPSGLYIKGGKKYFKK